MPLRATKRGDARTPLHGEWDVLVCGASFAGLTVARELARTDARVLIVDRYEIGERATSACAAPTTWLERLGLTGAVQQTFGELVVHVPGRTFRWPLPFEFSTFDYRRICSLLREGSAGAARFETAKVEGRTGFEVHTDRGDLRAPLIVDALGWRRVLGAGANVQPPDAPISRGLEVHPDARGGDTDLDVWIDRSLIRRGYAWSVPAAGEQRVGVGSYEPRDHVREPTVRLATREGHEAVRYQGNWFPHRLRPAADERTFFAGDSAGHCFPLSGEGIRTAFYFGIAAGRQIRAVLDGAKSSEAALQDYAAFSERHAPAFRRALLLQRLIPALPPRALTVGLRAFQPFVNRAFSWYLDQAHPGMAMAWEPTQTPSSRGSRPSAAATSTP